MRLLKFLLLLAVPLLAQDNMAIDPVTGRRQTVQIGASVSGSYGTTLTVSGFAKATTLGHIYYADGDSLHRAYSGLDSLWKKLVGMGTGSNEIQIGGLITGLTSLGFTEGQYWLQPDSTLGTLPDTTTGNYRAFIGYAVSPDSFYLDLNSHMMIYNDTSAVSSGESSDGGTAPALDTIFYDYIFGSTAQDSASYGGFSGFRYYTGGLADSAIGVHFLKVLFDTLDTGGNAFLLPGDTLYIFNKDSVLTDTITGTVNVYGNKYQSIIRGTGEGLAGYIRDGFTDGRLIFHSLNMGTETVGNVADKGLLYLRDDISLTFNDCYLKGYIPYVYSNSADGKDSLMQFINCEFEDHSIEVWSDGNDDTYEFYNCYGTVREHYWQRNSQYRVIYDACNFYFKGEGVNFAGQGYAHLMITGGHWQLGPSVAEMGAGNCWANLTGVTFEWDNAATSPYWNFNSSGRQSVSSCTFIDGGLKIEATNAACNITGSSFWNYESGATIGINIDDDDVTVTSCVFRYWTTAIDIAAGKSNVVVGGCTGGANTTDINGTPNTIYNNHFN